MIEAPNQGGTKSDPMPSESLDNQYSRNMLNKEVRRQINNET